MTTTNRKRNARQITGDEVKVYRSARWPVKEWIRNEKGDVETITVQRSGIIVRAGSMYLVRTGQDTSEWTHLA